MMIAIMNTIAAVVEASVLSRPFTDANTTLFGARRMSAHGNPLMCELKTASLSVSAAVVSILVAYAASALAGASGRFQAPRNAPRTRSGVSAYWMTESLVATTMDVISAADRSVHDAIFARSGSAGIVNTTEPITRPAIVSPVTDPTGCDTTRCATAISRSPESVRYGPAGVAESATSAASAARRIAAEGSRAGAAPVGLPEASNSQTLVYAWRLLSDARLRDSDSLILARGIAGLPGVGGKPKS
jgi:hypothetical protein